MKKLTLDELISQITPENVRGGTAIEVAALHGEIVDGEIPGLDCRLCGSPTEKFKRDDQRTCSHCHVSFTYIDGKWKLDNEDGWPNIPLTGMRHRITLIVRSELHDYHRGKEIPPERLKFLVALLLDHHCALEGQIVSERQKPRPSPSPRPPLPRKPPNKLPPPPKSRKRKA